MCERMKQTALLWVGATMALVAIMCWDEEPREIRRITLSEAKERNAIYPKASLPYKAEPHCIVYAKDFYLHEGGSVKNALTADKSKIRGDVIDARGINIIDRDGHPVLYIDDTGIHWATKYSPFKYQYAASASGPWHDTRSTNDEYRRESTDGGTTWSDGIKFIARDGRDGADGSDADVTRKNIEKALKYASSLGESYFAIDSVGASVLYGGKIFGSEIYAGGTMGANGIEGTGSVISLTPDGIKMYNNDNDTSLNITSTKIPSLGAVTMLSNQSRPLYLTSQDVLIGHSMGTQGAVGLQVSANETIFAGNINLGYAKVTNWGDNHPTAVFK